MLVTNVRKTALLAHPPGLCGKGSKLRVDRNRWDGPCPWYEPPLVHRQKYTGQTMLPIDPHSEHKSK